MLRFKDQSLSLQLPVIAALGAFLVSLCLLWLATTSGTFLLDQQEQRHGDALARQIAAGLREPLQRGDLLSARAMLQRFIDESQATAVTITDVEGKPMGSAGAMVDSSSGYSAPIEIGQDIVGEVRVSIADPSRSEGQWRFLFSLFALAVALSLLAFLLTRVWARRLAAALGALQSELLLPDSNPATAANELTRLEQTVRDLPMDMLRGHAEVPVASTEFIQGSIIFVHLASLARYVNTLGETNLHRYSRRLQQILQAAAQCYRGELSVIRPFGVLIRFKPQNNAGSEALRAASCARLLGLIAQGLQARTSLSIDLAIAVDFCEQAAEDAEDMYPQLHLQGTVDELYARCLSETSFPAVLFTEEVMADAQLAKDTQVQARADGYRQLLNLAPEQEALIEHQATMIVDRIKPLPGNQAAAGDERAAG